MLVALVIAAMVLTAILGVYARANRAAQAVLRKIDTPVLAAEVLQLIAEDLDRALGADDVTIQVKNGFDNGFVTAQLILRRTVRTIDNREQMLEEIVWRGAYDYDSAIPGLVVYRSYEGVGFEDKLLDAKRATLESERPFIPVCRGVTFFKIEIPKGDGYLDRWADTALPAGVKVTLSFASPYETVRGTLDVLDHEKTSRTIAVDRTRTIKFTLPQATDAGDGKGQDDPNTAEEPESEGTDERPTRSTRRR
jgi:hypothetical protein